MKRLRRKIWGWVQWRIWGRHHARWSVDAWEAERAKERKRRQP